MTIQSKGGIPRLGFFGSTALWSAGIIGIVLIRWVIAPLLGSGFWHPGQLLALLPAWIGQFLPFTAFAGGVAARNRLTRYGLVRRAALITIVSYILLAYLTPLAQYQDYLRTGRDLEASYPFGPPTPSGLLAHRAAVVENPPEAYSFRANEPLSRPPNWLAYRLLISMGMAGFAIFSALLGYWIAGLTTGLSPPNRLLARWGLGLLFAVLFFAGELLALGWVRADPSHSGLAGVLIPWVGPLVGVAVLRLGSRRRQRARPGNPGL